MHTVLKTNTAEWVPAQIAGSTDTNPDLIEHSGLYQEREI